MMSLEVNLLDVFCSMPEYAVRLNLPYPIK